MGLLFSKIRQNERIDRYFQCEISPRGLALQGVVVGVGEGKGIPVATEIAVRKRPASAAENVAVRWPPSIYIRRLPKMTGHGLVGQIHNPGSINEIFSWIVKAVSCAIQSL
jgi:hypothetical protein